MCTHQEVSIGINFQQVSIVGIKHQASVKKAIKDMKQRAVRAVTISTPVLFNPALEQLACLAGGIRPKLLFFCAEGRSLFTWLQVCNNKALHCQGKRYG